MLESVFNKVAGLKAFNVIKKHSNTGFSCEYYEIFKNTILKNISKWLLWIQHVFHKYKAEETEVISRLLITLLTNFRNIWAKYFVYTHTHTCLYTYTYMFMVLGKMLPGKMSPGKCPPEITPQENCPLQNSPPLPKKSIL